MRKILCFLAAALFATTAFGAEVTTTGLLGVSGESGLVDGASVSDQTLTFKPTANGGAIMIQVFDDAGSTEFTRHVIPVKSLTLNSTNPIFQLKNYPTTAVTAALPSDSRLVAYVNGIAPRVEITMVGKVTGELGGSKIDGLGDGLFVWRPVMAASAGGWGSTASFVGGSRRQSFGGGWQDNWRLLETAQEKNLDGQNAINKALCATSVCANPAAADTCSTYASAHSVACQAVCNCALTTGSNSWGTCTTGTPSCNW